jgi:hypothetical protein
LLFDFVAVVPENNEQWRDFSMKNANQMFQKRESAQGEQRLVAPHAARFPGSQNDAGHRRSAGSGA